MEIWGSLDFLCFSTQITIVFVLIYLSVCLFQSKLKIKDIHTRTVLITGCDTGFGNLLAKSLDARGVRVFAGCLTKKGAEVLREETSDKMNAFMFDVTKRESVVNVLNLVKQALGNEGLWGLVNNAGVMPSMAPIEWISMEEYEFTCNVNLFGPISVTKAFLPLLRKSQGRVVNVCSVTSQHGLTGLSSYVISKAALKIFSACLRRELLHTGVTVHTIEPGGFKTNVTNARRIQKALLENYKYADPEPQDVYGGDIATYLYTGIGRINAFILNTDPQLVPDAITDALFARFPKRTYLVGRDAHFVFPILSWMPSWMVDRLLSWPRPYGPKMPVIQEQTQIVN